MPSVLCFFPAGGHQTAWFEIAFAAFSVLTMSLFYLARAHHSSAQSLQRVADAPIAHEQAARELNDTLLQSFQAIVLRFHLATCQVAAADPVRKQLEEILIDSDQVMAQGREQAMALYSTIPGIDDLSQALAAVSAELQKSNPSSVRVIVEGKIRELQPILRDEVYRIGREAITNSFRHAGASSIETELSYERSGLRLCFRDNGAGMTSSSFAASMVAKAHNRDRGLLGMRARARRIGAHLDVWSRQNIGTEIVLRIPSDVAYTATVEGPRMNWLRRLILS
jgi:signal transduction histidine kinase